MTRTSERVLELQKQIEEKQAHQSHLMRELARSLAIGELWPGVWDRARKEGLKVSSTWRVGPERMTFHIFLRNADGEKVEEREFRRPDVPVCLRFPKAEEDMEEKLKRQFAHGKLRKFREGKI